MVLIRLRYPQGRPDAVKSARVNIDCKQCGRPIAAEDINIERLIAKCQSCNAVFGFAEDVPGRRASSAPRASSGPERGRYRREKVPLPRGFHVEDTGLGLQIVHVWMRPIFIFLVFFCIMWCGFLVLWFSMAMSTDAPLFVLLFPLIHVAVGVALIYFTVAGFVNRTVIDVSGQAVNIRHTPLPWPGAKSIPSHTLDQLYVVQQIRHGSRGRHIYYDLRAVDKQGRQVDVLKHLAQPEQALYLEQAIENRLGIEDRHVPGQIPS